VGTPGICHDSILPSKRWSLHKIQGESTSRSPASTSPTPKDPTKEPYNFYRYTAKRFDPTSGRYDLGFRDYDPGLNRFLTRDLYNGALADLNLATDPFTNNRYTFAAGNPTTLVDQTGHTPTADNPVSANPQLNVYLNTTWAVQRTARLVAGTKDAAAAKDTICENLGVCVLNPTSPGGSRNPFEHAVPQAICGSGTWAQASQSATNPLKPAASSDCLIYLQMALGLAGPTTVVPGVLNMSGSGPQGGIGGVSGESNGQVALEFRSSLAGGGPGCLHLEDFCLGGGSRVSGLCGRVELGEQQVWE
jgi:RHS repeat-associated protein